MTPSPGWVSIPKSFVSVFIFYHLSYLLLMRLGCLSGCLVSSTSVQKLFCDICSAFKWSSDEFCGKVVSPSYTSAILRPPLFSLFKGYIGKYQSKYTLHILFVKGTHAYGSLQNHLAVFVLKSQNPTIPIPTLSTSHPDLSKLLIVPVFSSITHIVFISMTLDNKLSHSSWFINIIKLSIGFPDVHGKESTCNAGDPSSIPRSGRSAEEGISYPFQCPWASLVAQLVKNLPAMWETWVLSLGWEDPLKKSMETHSNILACGIPWTVTVPLFTGWQRVEHDWVTFTCMHLTLRQCQG